jgi:hypothetical protein
VVFQNAYSGIHCDLRRFLAYLLLTATFLCQASAQRGTHDPEFEKIPFDKWLDEPDQLHFRWTVKVPHAELSFHQRLMSSIDVRLDGQDLESRRHNGTLLILIQLTDAEGAKHQEHGTIELNMLDPDVKEASIDYSQRAFFVPGDYRLAVAILDTGKGEHSATQIKVHLPERPREWLSEAWRTLPSVEFIHNDVSPESWYLPYIRSRVPWAASVHTQAQLNIVMNLSPSGRTAGSSLASLLPSLKVIASPGSSSISERIALLDLGRHKTVFGQNDGQDLDWPRLKSSLKDASTASIDVHSLADHQDNAQYFLSEVRRLIRSSAREKSCVLAVLTKPVAFDKGDNLAPISLEALPPCQVIYIRFHAEPAIRPPMPDMGGGMGRRSRMGGGQRMGGSPFSREPFDQLAATLKPLNPKIIDVEAPDQVTKALIEITKAISK